MIYLANPFTVTPHEKLKYKSIQEQQTKKRSTSSKKPVIKPSFP